MKCNSAMVHINCFCLHAKYGDRIVFRIHQNRVDTHRPFSNDILDAKSNLCRFRGLIRKGKIGIKNRIQFIDLSMMSIDLKEKRIWHNA